MSKRILVTGATGFLGSYIVKMLLDQDIQVVATKRKTSSFALVEAVKDQIEWHEGDLLDVPFLFDLVKGVDEIYHAAAFISFDPRDVDQMMAINIEGTANIVNAALAAGTVKKLLHVSSIAALGRKPHQVEVDEQLNWENSKENSNYAISKFRAECEVWRGMEEGLSAVIVNPSVILGAGVWKMGSCKLFEKVWEGLSFYSKGMTGFVDVRDVASISIQLMQSTIEGERFILNAENLLYKDFFASLAKALDKPAPSKLATPLMTNFIWRLEAFRSKITGKSPLITRETARTAQGTYFYKNDKVKTILNIEFIPVAQTIKETATLFQVSMKENKLQGTLI